MFGHCTDIARVLLKNLDGKEREGEEVAAVS